MTIYQTFEAAIRSACDDWQAARIDQTQFIERVFNARNALDIALIEEQG